MPKEAEMWWYLKDQVDALEALINYTRQAGNTLPLGNITLIHGIYDNLCRISRDARDKFADLAILVARRYAWEIYAGTIILTDILFRRDLSKPIDHPQLPEDRFIPMGIVDSADFRGRLEKLCKLYSLEMTVRNTNPA